MPLQPQHQSKCYCNNNSIECCNLIESSKFGKSNSGTKPKFIHINRKSATKTTAARHHGLGHSDTKQRDFSRRNSAATIATTITANSTINRKLTNSGTKSVLPFLEPASPKTVMSNPQYTERRSYYERSKELLQQMGLARINANDINAIENAASTYDYASNNDHSHNVNERFYALQQFRLKYLNDCFSVHRQNDLKMLQYQQHEHQQQQYIGKTISNKPQHFCITMKPYNSNCLEKTDAAINLEQQQDQRPRQTHKKQENSQYNLAQLTPYAVRQKILQLRLQADAINERKSKCLYSCAALDKSLALKFQETY